MQIGLYFGSFNPIHHGHLIIANFIANQTDIQQVWFVVSPQNPLKTSNVLLNEYHRLHLVRLAIEDDSQLRVSDVEFKLPTPSYTIDTVSYLKEKFPENTFSIILGSDSYKNLPKWKNFGKLVKENKLVVYKRPNFDVPQQPGTNITIIQAPLLEISATYIRNNIKEGKSIRYLVPEKVREEIERNGYYRLKTSN
jgi:nicotinate-nucleotide adenylyltransferase